MKSKTWDYLGHSIELRAGREKKGAPELVVDGQTIAYGQLFDGTYFLHENAYAWSDDLGKLAPLLIDYRTRVQAIDVRPRTQERTSSSMSEGDQHGSS